MGVHGLGQNDPAQSSTDGPFQEPVKVPSLRRRGPSVPVQWRPSKGYQIPRLRRVCAITPNNACARVIARLQCAKFELSGYMDGSVTGCRIMVTALGKVSWHVKNDVLSEALSTGQQHIMMNVMTWRSVSRKSVALSFMFYNFSIEELQSCSFN